MNSIIPENFKLFTLKHKKCDAQNRKLLKSQIHKIPIPCQSAVDPEDSAPGTVTIEERVMPETVNVKEFLE